MPSLCLIEFISWVVGQGREILFGIVDIDTSIAKFVEN